MEHSDLSSTASWVTRDEAARLLGVTVRTIDRLRRKRLLVDLRPSGQVRICLASLEEYARRKIELNPLSLSNYIMPIESDQYDGMVLEIQRGKTAEKRLIELENEFARVEAAVRMLNAVMKLWGAVKARLATFLMLTGGSRR